MRNEDAGRNAKVFGKDREFIGFLVSVGIFADTDSITTFTLRLSFVGIVVGFRNV